MRFESKEQKEGLIKQFQERVTFLENEKKNDPKTDKNYNCKVELDYRIEYDESVQIEQTGRDIVVISEGENVKGDIYFFVLRQPNLLESIKIISAAKPPLGNEYNSGLTAWDIMIDKKESSEEIFTDRIKLGYLLKFIGKIDVLLSDQKKS